LGKADAVHAFAQRLPFHSDALMLAPLPVPVPVPVHLHLQLHLQVQVLAAAAKVARCARHRDLARTSKV
jgi:hypothetical protein